jgi:hypothetical protein
MRRIAPAAPRVETAAVGRQNEMKKAAYVEKEKMKGAEPQ